MSNGVRRRDKSPVRSASSVLFFMLLACTMPAPSRAAQADANGKPVPNLLAVAVGQEWRYTGAATRHVSGRPVSARAVRLVAWATVTRKARERLEVAQFRDAVVAQGWPAKGVRLPNATVVWLSTIRLSPSPPEATAPPWGSLVPALEGGIAGGLSLPVPLGTGLRPGQEHITYAPLFTYPPPAPQNVPLRRRVVGVQRIGSRPCLVVEGTVAAPLPLQASRYFRLLAYKERFWIDRASGALVRFRGEARLQEGPGVPGPQEAAPVRVTAEIHLAEVRRLSATQLSRRREQAQTLSQTLQALGGGGSGAPGESQEDRMKRATKTLQRLRETDPGSPYAPVALALERDLRARQGAQMQRARQEIRLMEQPAPELRLKDLEGKERTLAEFRGKLILLNFSASW